MSYAHPLRDPMAVADEIDIGALFDAHAAYLCRVVHRLTGSGQVAEDVVQDVFITAWQRRHELDPNSNVRTWLYRVAVNHVRHQRRAKGRLSSFLARYSWIRPAPPAHPPDEGVERADHARLVQACVLKLSDKQREVFVLYELEEMEGAEIAEILAISVNTVWSRLRLARASFREHWTAQQEVSP